jgi:hypothetical protein
MKKLFAVLIVLVLAVAVTAEAGTNSVMVGAGIVMPMGGDVEKGKMGVGASLLIPIKGHFGLEAEILQFGDHLEAVDMTLVKVGASAVYRRQKDRFWGLVKGGLDYNQIEFTSSLPGIEINVDNAIGYHVGVAGGIKLTDRLGLSLELTKYWLDTTAKVWGCGVSETVEGSYDHDLIKVGLTYRF